MREVDGAARCRGPAARSRSDVARKWAVAQPIPGGEYTGGSAGSGFTAAVGAPTLCGTGPIRAKAHTPDEVCHLDMLVPRAQALALAIARLPA